MTDHANPLLSNLKLPGRIFQLPSRGIFYKNGELADTVRDGEIHIQAMSALEEIIMKNPDQLFSGEAINTVLAKCSPDIKKPSELLSKDVDAIMLYLRTVTYGPNYEFTARHNCEHARDHSYIADVDQMISACRMIDPTMIESMYTVQLPNSQVVRLHPNRYQQVIDIIKQNQNKASITAEDQKNNFMALIMGVIESVDGIRDRKLITEWIGAIPAPMINRIGDKVEGLNDWGSDLSWTCTCRDCGEQFKVEIPIQPVSFFTE